MAKLGPLSIRSGVRSDTVYQVPLREVEAGGIFWRRNPGSLNFVCAGARQCIEIKNEVERHTKSSTYDRLSEAEDVVPALSVPLSYRRMGKDREKNYHAIERVLEMLVSHCAGE